MGTTRMGMCVPAHTRTNRKRDILELRGREPQDKNMQDNVPDRMDPEHEPHVSPFTW